MNNEEEYKETELGLLPKEWRVVTLGNMDLFKILGSGINKFEGKKDYLSTTSIHINKIKEIECSINFKNRPSRANMQPIMNSVWFAKMKNTNKVYSFTAENKDEIEKYILSTGFCGILCKTEVDPIFLRMVFISDYFNKLKDTLSHGTTQQAVNTDDIKSICFPLPLPLEQKRIAFVLSSIEKSKEKTQNLINSLKELKKSAMKHLFTYGAVSFDDKDKIELKETEIGIMPKNWEVNKLGKIFEVQQGKQLSSRENQENKIKFPFLRTSNINWGKIILSNLDYMYFTQKEIEKLKLIEGDILVCEGGDIGRTAIWRGDLDNCAYQNHLHRLRIINNEEYNNFFFNYWMEYAIILNRMYIHNANRTTIPNLSASRLKDFSLPKPLLLDQQKISSILSSIDKKIEAEEQRVIAIEQLFKSLLHNLMSGKIRVKNLVIPEVKNG